MERDWARRKDARLSAGGRGRRRRPGPDVSREAAGVVVAVAEMGPVSGIWTGLLGERCQLRRLGLGEGLGAVPGGRSGLQVLVDAERPAGLCHLVPGAGPSRGGPCTRPLGWAPEVD